MVNICTLYVSFLQQTMKLVGLSPRKVEIEPAGTVMNIWAPIKPELDKPAVVFLQGFTACGMMTWHLEALSLARECSVYVPDLLFFGDSTTESQRRSVAFQAECVAECLRRIGAAGRPCVVVGFSYGGMVGVELARTRPDLVGALVITGSVLTMTESINQGLMDKMSGPFSSLPEFLLPETVQRLRLLFEFGTYKLPNWIPDWAFKHYLEVMFENRKQRSELLEALVVPDNQDPNKAPNLSQRVYLLWGKHDKITDIDLAKDLKEKLGDKATLVPIEKAGHLAPLERPFDYSRHLKKIVSDFVADDAKWK